MYNYQPSLDLDLTGVNPDNKIKNEPHTIGDLGYRGVVPRKGLFYEASLIVMDGSKMLVRNHDYICTPLHQDLSTKTGKGVFGGIVIINEDVGKNVSITYQAVGGPYGVDNDAIANLYESVINDTRPVHWKNVTNKPDEFPPSEHEHPLSDVVGWEPIVHQLERINLSINASKADLVKANILGLVTGFGCKELPKVLPSDRVMQYDSMLHFLSMKGLFGPLKVYTDTCKWSYGRMADFIIDTSGFPEGHLFYWRFYKKKNEDIYIPLKRSGVVFGNGGKVRVTLYVPGLHQHVNETLYIGVNNKQFIEDFEAVTYRLDFHDPLFGDSSYGMMAITTGPDSDGRTIPSAKTKRPVERTRYLLDHTSMVKTYQYRRI